jgi:hypothetical protein
MCAFYTLNALSRLDLNKNQLSSLEDRTFHGLFSLRLLNLSSNSIHVIQKNLFKDLLNLAELDLNKNPIISIQDNSIINLRNLLYLRLDTYDPSKNNTSITNLTFSGLNYSIKNVFISEKFLKNFTDSSNIKSNFEPIMYGSILDIVYYGSINVIYSKTYYQEIDCAVILRSIRFKIHLNLREQH